jgi:hypothetical protein
VVDSYAPGVVDGVWVRRGPFTVSVTDGALRVCDDRHADPKPRAA